MGRQPHFQRPAVQRGSCRVRPAAYPVKRFMAKVSFNADGCHIWRAQVKRDGYGSFSFRGKTAKAHKVAYILFRGEIPSGMCVLHRCDVRACVNPDHLFLGTVADNVRDMDAKGRRGTVEKLSQTEAVRVHFWSKWATQQRIADSFGIHQTTVSRIVRARAQI